MNFFIVKSIHIIFVVSYFAGIFYTVRLFIYQTEAAEKPEPQRSILVNQFKIMLKRLWNIITVPAFVIMLATGSYMIYLQPGFLKQSWMHVKLFCIICLIFYQLWSWLTIRQLMANQYRYSSIQLRMMNEVATLILFVVAFAVILKWQFMDLWYWVLISFVGLGLLIMAIVKLTYKGNNHTPTKEQ